MTEEDFIREHLGNVIERVFSHTGVRLTHTELRDYLKEILRDRIKATLFLKFRQVSYRRGEVPVSAEGVDFPRYLSVLDEMIRGDILGTETPSKTTPKAPKNPPKRPQITPQIKTRFDELYPDDQD